METIKLFGILLLCVGFINHLTDSIAVIFGLERNIYRVIFGFVGYAGFLLIWRFLD